MSEAPSFPFYANDFVGGRVATYNLDEIGAYSLLLAFDWTLNGLPTELEKLAKLCRVSTRKFQKIWSTIGEQFPERNGRRYNQRLALERAKKGIKTVQARDAAALRWQSEGNADASIPHPDFDATTTSTSSLPSNQVEVVSTAREESNGSSEVASGSGVPSPHIRLVVAANKGLAEHPTRPQPVPRLFAGQASSIQAADTILQAGVPLAFAESRIYGLARTHNADGEVKSLRYFAAATIRAWQEELARADADSAVIAPNGGQPTNGAREQRPGPGERGYRNSVAALEGL